MRVVLMKVFLMRVVFDEIGFLMKLFFGEGGFLVKVVF